MVKPSVRRRLETAMREMHEIMSVKHDSDLHEGVFDSGEMTFCPGCRGHLLLNRIHESPDDRAANQGRLQEITMLVKGTPGEARANAILAEVRKDVSNA